MREGGFMERDKLFEDRFDKKLSLFRRNKFNISWYFGI